MGRLGRLDGQCVLIGFIAGLTTIVPLIAIADGLAFGAAAVSLRHSRPPRIAIVILALLTVSAAFSTAPGDSFIWVLRAAAIVQLLTTRQLHLSSVALGFIMPTAAHLGAALTQLGDPRLSGMAFTASSFSLTALAVTVLVTHSRLPQLPAFAGYIVAAAMFIGSGSRTQIFTNQLAANLNPAASVRTVMLAWLIVPAAIGYPLIAGGGDRFSTGSLRQHAGLRAEIATEATFAVAALAGQPDDAKVPGSIIAREPGTMLATSTARQSVAYLGVGIGAFGLKDGTIRPHNIPQLLLAETGWLAFPIAILGAFWLAGTGWRAFPLLAYVPALFLLEEPLGRPEGVWISAVIIAVTVTARLPGVQPGPDAGAEIRTA